MMIKEYPSSIIERWAKTAKKHDVISLAIIVRVSMSIMSMMEKMVVMIIVSIKSNEYDGKDSEGDQFGDDDYGHHEHHEHDGEDSGHDKPDLTSIMKKIEEHISRHHCSI